MDWGDLEKTIRFHFTFAGMPKKHKPVEIKTNHLHPPFLPTFFPVYQAALCQRSPQWHCQGKWGSWHTTQGPPHPENHSRASPERSAWPRPLRSSLGEEKSLPWVSGSPLLPTLELLNLTTVGRTIQPPLKGQHNRWIYKVPGWQAWGQSLCALSH